jgi:multimeric flavodoxin WrbA
MKIVGVSCSPRKGQTTVQAAMLCHDMVVIGLETARNLGCRVAEVVRRLAGSQGPRE